VWLQTTWESQDGSEIVSVVYFTQKFCTRHDRECWKRKPRATSLPVATLASTLRAPCQVAPVMAKKCDMGLQLQNACYRTVPALKHDGSRFALPAVCTGHVLFETLSASAPKDPATLQLVSGCFPSKSFGDILRAAISHRSPRLHALLVVKWAC